VIFLRAPGIALVSTTIILIFAAFFTFWHGLNLLPSALLAFGFAVLFTLAFTLLAVSAERARGDVERLACELSEANRRLREYSVQAEELAATRERNRLAREIHDTLGHYLTVVNVQIEAARVMFERDPQKAHDSLNKAQSLTQEGLLDIRRSVSALRASPLDNKDLVDVLRQSVEAMSSSGLDAEFKLAGSVRPLSQPIKLTLFRAAQEGLTNIQKHSRATRACLTLDFSRANRIRLTVSDNGVGSTDASTKGFGLIGLRERAHLAGGTLNIHANPSEGFTLEVEVPA
jgi:signal transduction histidine kinase